jgi:hypothetical protein
MKVLSIIFSFLLTIAIFVLTIWQIVIEAPAFVVCMLFVMDFMSLVVLCKCFDEFYDKKK